MHTYIGEEEWNIPRLCLRPSVTQQEENSVVPLSTASLWLTLWVLVCIVLTSNRLCVYTHESGWAAIMSVEGVEGL